MNSYRQIKRKKKKILPQTQMSKKITVFRAKLGYGFTVSGQDPCVLSCIVPGSPAEMAGLKAGHLLYSVNGQNVSRAKHDEIVNLIAHSEAFLEVEVAEDYNSSDSSDDDYLPGSKTRYPNRIRPRHSLDQKISRHIQSSSCLAIKHSSSSTDCLKHYCHYQVDSDLSSSLTSQEDHVWPDLANIGRHVLSQAWQEKKPDLNFNHVDPRMKFFAAKFSNQPIMSAAKQVSSAAAVVKRVPQVVDSIKNCQGNTKHKCEVAQLDMLLMPEFCVAKSDGNTTQPDKVTETCKAIVGYMGSVEIPGSQVNSGQTMQALRNTIRRFKVEKKVHTLVMMEITSAGVVLTNAVGKQLALYPNDRIGCCGIYSDDERFFGLVTLSTPHQECLTREDCLKPDASCHIFMIEPDISPHIAHIQHAEAFQVDCVIDPNTGQCDKFPRSAASVIMYIATLYTEKLSVKFDSDFVLPETFTNPYTQSQDCVSHSGYHQEAQNKQVCVIDMSDKRSGGSILSPRLNASLKCGQQSSSTQESTAAGIFTSYLTDSYSQEECLLQAGQPVDKLTPQAMPDPACLVRLNASQMRSTENLKQNMQRFLQARQQLLDQQNCDGESYYGEQVLSLSVSEDGHDVLETSCHQRRQPAEHIFAVPINPPPISIHHMAGRSAFHLLKSPSAPLGNSYTPELVDLETVDKLSPRAFPLSPASSSVSFRSPSVPLVPFYLQKDSDDDTDDGSEDDPYICQIIEQFKPDCGTARDGNSRLSERFDTIQKKETSRPCVQKWTKNGSFRQNEVVSLKQSFSLSLESLPVDVSRTDTHKLMTACSTRNIANQDDVSPAGRVARWAVHLDELLKDSLGISIFTEFLKKEFSDENVRFWKACEEFRGLTQEQQRKYQAKEIYTQYLSSEAGDPVNVDSTARLHTETFLDKPTAAMFDVAQHQIWQLMRQDSYPRFLKSDLYKRLLVEELEGRTVQDGKLSKCNKKKAAGKENSGKRRRSLLLPWRQYHKSAKVSSDSDLQRLNKKNKDKTTSQCHNEENVKISGGNCAANKNVGNMKQSSRLGIDLSTMRKEVFHQTEVYDCSESQVKFCRIIMPDGSTTVTNARPGESSRSVVNRLCEKRSLALADVDVYLLGSDKPLDLNEDMSALGSKEIVIEQRVKFCLNLPNGSRIDVIARPNRTAREALIPTLDKYGCSLDNMKLKIKSCDKIIDLDTPVSKLNSRSIDLVSETAGSQRNKVPLFGLFRTSGKGFIENKRTTKAK